MISYFFRTVFVHDQIHRLVLFSHFHCKMANDSGRKRKEETKRKSNLEAFKEELKQLVELIICISSLSFCSSYHAAQQSQTQLLPHVQFVLQNSRSKRRARENQTANSDDRREDEVSWWWLLFTHSSRTENIVPQKPKLVAATALPYPTQHIPLHISFCISMLPHLPVCCVLSQTLCRNEV